MNVFSYVLDTCRVNASTIYAINNDLMPRNIKLVDFRFELAMSLIRQIYRTTKFNWHKLFCGSQNRDSTGEKNLLQACKNIKWLFPHQVKNESDVMHVSVRLNEKEQKQKKIS